MLLISFLSKKLVKCFLALVTTSITIYPGFLREYNAHYASLSTKYIDACVGEMLIRFLWLIKIMTPRINFFFFKMPILQIVFTNSATLGSLRFA